MEHFESKGLRLEYTVMGEGKPLLFMHGMGGGIKQIESVYDATPGVMLICMNMQGHGDSGADWSDYRFDRLADDAAALLDRLGVSRVYAAGISMGAGVALNMASRFPERIEKLMLIRNAWADCSMSGQLIQAYGDLGRCLQSGGKESFYKTQGWETVKGPSAYTRAAFLSPFTEESALKYPEKYLLLPSEQAVSSAQAIKGISCPTMVLANKNDLCHPFELSEYICALIPKAEFLQIPDKDTDPKTHRRLINESLRELLTAKKHG